MPCMVHDLRAAFLSLPGKIERYYNKVRNDFISSKLGSIESNIPRAPTVEMDI